jgi:hypothetical protein
MDRELLFNLQKAIADVRETAAKEQVSYYLISQIERVADLIDLATPAAKEIEDDDFNPYALPW